MKIENITGLKQDTRSHGVDPRLIDNKTYIGVEIELQNMAEYSAYPLPVPSFWIVKNDGSLRDHGLEFITGMDMNGTILPIRGQDYTESLDVWKKWIEKYIPKYGYPDTSGRTSLHIHIDVRNMHKHEVDKLCLLWAIFEPTFFYSLLKNGREDNIFCKPLHNTIESRRRLGQLLKTASSSEIQHMYSGSSKYEAINLTSITYFGSVEFRIHQGTYDADQILNWTNILLTLKKAAMDENISVLDMPEMASNNGMVQFVGQVFGEYAHVILPIIDEKLFYLGVRQAQDIIHSDKFFKLHSSYLKNVNNKLPANSILKEWASKNNRTVYTEE